MNLIQKIAIIFLLITILSCLSVGIYFLVAKPGQPAAKIRRFDWVGDENMICLPVICLSIKLSSRHRVSQLHCPASYLSSLKCWNLKQAQVSVEYIDLLVKHSAKAFRQKSGLILWKRWAKTLEWQASSFQVQQHVDLMV